MKRMILSWRPSIFISFIPRYMYCIASRISNLCGCAKMWVWVHSITQICQVFGYDGDLNIDLGLEFSGSRIVSLAL